MGGWGGKEPRPHFKWSESIQLAMMYVKSLKLIVAVDIWSNGLESPKKVKSCSEHLNEAEKPTVSARPSALCVRFGPLWDVRSLKAVTISHSYLHPQDLCASSPKQ